MPHTQAVYYRDSRGQEPVDEFINRLPAKRAAKIDDYVEEYLNGQPRDAPPTGYPITSQVDGELRELRVRFANTRYRLLYQRSGNLVVLLHAIEKDSGAIPPADIEIAKARMRDFKARMDARTRRPPRAAGTDAPMHSRRRRWIGDLSILINSLRCGDRRIMDTVMSYATSRARRRAEASEDYRAAHDEYAAIRELRARSWIAAHIRERRYELELTQHEVAARAGTSHSYISKLESGDHIPTIPVLTRILAVLDERLLIGVERDVPDSEPDREFAPVSQHAVA